MRMLDFDTFLMKQKVISTTLSTLIIYYLISSECERTCVLKCEITCTRVPVTRGLPSPQATNAGDMIIHDPNIYIKSNAASLAPTRANLPPPIQTMALTTGHRLTILVPLIIY
jgi:hypothetical protein